MPRWESTAILVQGQATETLIGSHATDTPESTVVETNTPEFRQTETATQTEISTPANSPALAATILSMPIHTDRLQWIISEHLGSASTTANADDIWNCTNKCTAFGEICTSKGITTTKYRNTGQLTQAELGLYYYLTRWYDPAKSYFTQADTIIPEPSNA